jgi:Cytochrome P460
MKPHSMALAATGWALLCASTLGEPPDAAGAPWKFASEGQLIRPEHYREWVFLTSGFDMSYAAGMQRDHHMFDNVFVNPDAYRVFMATGSWPDQTMLVIEIRGAEERGSINKSGSYQGPKLMGLEVHVKDATRFPGKWAFFEFEGNGSAKVLPQSADCYSCHAEHAAVDTTFVQFYPTLLPIARSKGTLSPAYRP